MLRASLPPFPSFLAQTMAPLPPQIARPLPTSPQNYPECLDFPVFLDWNKGPISCSIRSGNGSIMTRRRSAGSLARRASLNLLAAVATIPPNLTAAAFRVFRVQRLTARPSQARRLETATHRRFRFAFLSTTSSGPRLCLVAGWCTFPASTLPLSRVCGAGRCPSSADRLIEGVLP
jgi:hypothetical protein